jgi:FkbM family methyltransferase
MNMVADPGPRPLYFLSRVGVALREWARGSLTTRQLIRLAMRVARFERWGVRPITQARFIALNNTAPPAMLVDMQERLGAASATVARLHSLEDEHRRAVQANADATVTLADTRDRAGRSAARELQLQHALDAAQQKIQHLQAVSSQYAALMTSTDALVTAHNNARAGTQAFVDAFQAMLFEISETTSQSTSAATLILGNQKVSDAIETLVNLSDPVHGARPFQYVVPFLAESRRFPLDWPVGAAPMRIVDVGSQELSTESDMHAPLRLVGPVDTIGFDPFAPPSDAPDGVTVVVRHDGGTIRTYPHLLADGNPVTFHINRYDPTSSTLPADHVLTRPFGLLDLAVETVETRSLPSRRLDDVLADNVAVDLLKIDVQGAAHTVLAHSRALLARTLVCHIEAEFVPIYQGERLFADIDTLMREAGFGFVDFFSLGRQRYASFDTSSARAFHRGRTLWADCVYVRGLDDPNALSPDELFRQAAIVHACYNKQDLAAELLSRADAQAGTTWRDSYIQGLAAETRA